MSQRAERRSRAAARGTGAATAGGGQRATPPTRVEIKGDPAFFRRINYRAVGAGFVVALAVYTGIGYLVSQTLVSAHDSASTQDAVYSSVGFLAMFCGGLTAGMIEPKYGVLNGPLVAVLFIFVAFVLTFFHELQLVKQVGPLGLGPMRVDRVFAQDVPQLAFSSFGGMTAGLIEKRFRRDGAQGVNGKKPAG